jgi:heme-degrading monooxygenase HmoA
MIYQRIEMPVTPGQEDEFERAVPRARAIFEGAKGVRSVLIARETENGSRYMLLPQWDSLEDHRAFHATAEFHEFRDLVDPLLAGPPEIAYFAALE